ncbi:MAG: hypothetical protein J6K14_07625 [Clostridia bacterium]|nr:hypothetical protein [Clostridia bacterium]
MIRNECENEASSAITVEQAEEFVQRLDREIQEILYRAFGQNLETLPLESILPGLKTKSFFEQLSKLRTVEQQKILLMRLGLFGGERMKLEQIEKELGISRQRARETVGMFLRRAQRIPLTRRKNSSMI